MNINFQKYFNLSALSQEQQALVINAITGLVLARLADVIADHLTEQELKELEVAGKSNDSAAVIDWLNEYIPNFSQGLDEMLRDESKQIATQVSALTNYALGS
jgi:hypothetical protein